MRELIQLRIRKALIFAAFVLALHAPRAGADRYVAQAGQTPSGGYTSWDTASTNIQDAVSVADIDETVWISNGVYTVGLSNQIVYINRGVKLRGFSGNRDDVILEGPAANEPARSTRGVYISSSTNNYVLVDSITISNCTSTDYGAGIYIVGNATYPGTAEVRNCSVLNGSNRFGSVGGGSVVSWQSAGSGYHTIMTNCLIANNWASNRNFAGGWFNNGKGTVDNCVFAANGISVNTDRGYGFGMGASGTVRNCRFERHTKGGPWGMALSVGNNAIIENCTVISNWGPNGSGIYAEGVSNIIIRNCQISHNRTTANGGGFYLWNASMKIENCTIISNNSGLIIRQTGALTGTVVMVNNIVCSNNVNFEGIAGYFYATNNCSSTALGAYGPGNITDSPRFLDFNGFDFRLAPDSPCINTGTNQDWMNGFVDQDRLPRVMQNIVDRGAYESIYGYFGLGPDNFTNTVMRGYSTNMTFSLSNTASEIAVDWQAAVTDSWIQGQMTGVIAASSSSARCFTNNSLAQLPGTHSGRITFLSSANNLYPHTGAVDMVLHVAEFTRNPTQVVATVRQFGHTNRTLTIWNSGSGNIPYTLYTNTSWLAAEPSSGVLTGNTEQVISVSFTNTALPLGVYYGALTLVPGISGEPFEVNVELTVTTGPRMTMTPLSLARTVMMGQSPEGQQLYISNVSTSEAINCRVDWDQSWLSVSPSNSIVLMPGATSTLAVSYSTSGLTTNISGQSNYNAIITVTATNTDTIGSPASASVTVTVNP
ncbi:MAG: right-handed parallel beta-helix repeat-containing protein, partial [Kiritimatiellia bacterium]